MCYSGQVERVASEFLRALRGKRSQLAFARRLGYRGNPITDWERGARFPTAVEALRAAARANIDVAAAFRRFAPDVPALLEALRGAYPEAECALRHRGPFELLAATILSAQCTDARVNMVTPDLFRRWPGPAELAAAPQAAVESVVRSTGFFRNKAKSLRGMAAAIRDRHGGEVPRTMEELTKLPGVGRKTANVVLGNAFGINVGVTVDTHVSRVSKRLGLTSHDDPVKIEQDLMKIVPQDEWCQWSHLLIHHGRAICKAPRPLCEQCPLLAHCPTGPKILRERGRPAKARTAKRT